MSVWRGRPLVLAGGISDSNRAHCASVRSLGNPLPDCLCASRCSLVHIPNHLLPILAETVNHAAVDNSRNFWVRLLAGQIDPRDVGIFFYVGSAASDVGDALALYSRYCRIANEAIRQKFTPRPGGATLEIEFAGLPSYATRQNTEFILGCFRIALR